MIAVQYTVPTAICVMYKNNFLECSDSYWSVLIRQITSRYGWGLWHHSRRTFETVFKSVLMIHSQINIFSCRVSRCMWNIVTYYIVRAVEGSDILTVGSTFGLKLALWLSWVELVSLFYIVWCEDDYLDVLYSQ